MQNESRAVQVLLQFRLDFKGSAPCSRAEKRRYRIASWRVGVYIRKCVTLGEWIAIETRAAEHLARDHGWLRVGGRMVPRENVEYALKVERQSKLNPRLLAELKNFRTMSPGYRASVARGAMSGIKPLP